MKFVRVFVLVLSLFAIHFSLFAGRVAAQTAPVPNRKVPCNETDSPEFHSLRPYQASATCITEAANYAKFCGNTLTIQESVTVTYSPKEDNCIQSSPGKVLCTYAIPVAPHRIIINLTGANLPIMGNTEEVVNSTNPIDPNLGFLDFFQSSSTTNISPAERVNNYVSWYLNGIFNQAEYFPTFINNPNVPSIPDYSGPLNKLLPQDIAFQSRINTIEKAVGKDVNGDGKIPEQDRHDQIVGCTLGYKVPILGTEVGGYPIPCYVDLGLLGNIYLNTYLQKWRLSDWPKYGRLPPIRSDFSNYTEYYQKYRAWRGDRCLAVTIPSNFLGIKIPLVGGMTMMLCGDDPLNPNFWSNLYQYIPLSSTEDIKGNIMVDSVSGAGLTNVAFNNQVPSTLFFPHLQESSELGSSLQDTYLAKGEPKTGPDTAVAPASSCNNLEVRSNKGDNLFATALWGDLSYTANFSCVFNPPSCSGSPSPTGGDICKFRLLGSCVPSNWTCTKSFGQVDCPAGYACGQGCFCSEPTQTCSKTISIALSTTSNTPKIDDVWSRLVAGPTAVVKRMFPKLGTQIGLLKDMPGSTSVTITGAESSSADLNFPHIGGISEYFLKGIQTLLRPKGYGETISFGNSSEQQSCNGQADLPNLPTGSGACKLTSTSIGGITLPPTMVSILEAAAQTYNVPPGLVLGVIFGEGTFNPGKYDWTEENVQTWSCASIPNCSGPSTSIVDLTGWSTLANQILPDLQRIDPNKSEADPCNLLDAVFALTKNLHGNAGGSSALTGKHCLNQTMTSTYPTSCTWNGSQYETSIRVWEFGTQWGNTSYGFLTCATKQNSCSTGGGVAAQCPTDTINNTDTCDNSSNANSHNACIWDVAHSH